MALLELITALCTLLILAGQAEGQDTGLIPTPSPSLFLASSSPSAANPPSCTGNPRILQAVVIASILIFVCFVLETIGVAILVSRSRQNHGSNGEWTPPVDRKDGGSQNRPRSARSSTSDKRASEIPWAQVSHGKQLPHTPSSWIGDGDTVDLESIIDVTIQAPSPLLHTKFLAPTPSSSVPGTPIPSSNIFANGRQTWVTGELDRLAVFRLPSYHPESTRDNDAISMAAVQEDTDRPSGTAQDTDTFALQQIVAKLKWRIRELEMQQGLLREGSWIRSSVPSYKSD